MRNIYNRKRAAKIRPAAITCIILGSVLLIIWAVSLAANREPAVRLSAVAPEKSDKTSGRYGEDIDINPQELPFPGPSSVVFIVGKRSCRYHWRHDCPTFYKRTNDGPAYSKAYFKRVSLLQIQAQERGLVPCIFCQDRDAQDAKDGGATER